MVNDNVITHYRLGVNVAEGDYHTFLHFDQSLYGCYTYVGADPHPFYMLPAWWVTTW